MTAPTDHDDAEPFDQPSSVQAKDGQVAVRGPDGVDVALTPLAAAETGERLIYAAAHARGQQIAAEQAVEERQKRHGHCPDS